MQYMQLDELDRQALLADLEAMPRKLGDLFAGLGDHEAIRGGPAGSVQSRGSRPGTWPTSSAKVSACASIACCRNTNRSCRISMATPSRASATTAASRWWMACAPSMPHVATTCRNCVACPMPRGCAVARRKGWARSRCATCRTCSGSTMRHTGRKSGAGSNAWRVAADEEGVAAGCVAARGLRHLTAVLRQATLVTPAK